MNLYVGNLSNTVNESDLRETFQAFGEVTTASVIKDKFSGPGFLDFRFPHKVHQALWVRKRNIVIRMVSHGRASAAAAVNR